MTAATYDEVTCEMVLSKDHWRQHNVIKWNTAPLTEVNSSSVALFHLHCRLHYVLCAICDAYDGAYVWGCLCSRDRGIHQSELISTFAYITGSLFLQSYCVVACSCHACVYFRHAEQILISKESFHYLRRARTIIFYDIVCYCRVSGDCIFFALSQTPKHSSVLAWGSKLRRSCLNVKIG